MVEQPEPCTVSRASSKLSPNKVANLDMSWAAKKKRKTKNTNWNKIFLDLDMHEQRVELEKERERGGEVNNEHFLQAVRKCSKIFLIWKQQQHEM